MADLVATTNLLVQRIHALLEDGALAPHHRILVALAGVPGSGKSTISSELMARLQEENIGPDGFHYSKADLSKFSDPETAFRRRGAPFTFDAERVVELIALLRRTPIALTNDSATEIKVPSFDHALQDPLMEAICIPSSNRVVIIEGNYLLFDEPPWDKIASMVDDRWFVDVSANTARFRLIKRHIAAGIESSVSAAAARVDENDMLNADLIRQRLLKPDVIIQN